MKSNSPVMLIYVQETEKKTHLVVSLSLKSTGSSVACKLIFLQMKRSLIEWKIIYIIVVALVSKPSLFRSFTLLLSYYLCYYIASSPYKVIAKSHRRISVFTATFGSAAMNLYMYVQNNGATRMIFLCKIIIN